MKTLWCGFLFLMLCRAIWAQVPPAGLAPVFKELQAAGSVKYVLKCGDLPTSVIEVARNLLPSKEFKIADSGQEWNATDVVLDPKLPFRRLIWAVEVKGYYVLHYELGGQGYSTHFFVISPEDTNGKRGVKWVAASFKRDPDLNSFVTEAGKGKLDSDPKIER